MPHTILDPIDLPAGVLDDSAYPPNEPPAPGPLPLTEASLPLFNQEVEGDHLSEETLMYKEIVVFLTLILFVLIRSLLV